MPRYQLTPTLDFLKDLSIVRQIVFTSQWINILLTNNIDNWVPTGSNCYNFDVLKWWAWIGSRAWTGPLPKTSSVSVARTRKHRGRRIREPVKVDVATTEYELRLRLAVSETSRTANPRASGGGCSNYRERVPSSTSGLGNIADGESASLRPCEGVEPTENYISFQLKSQQTQT